MNHRFLVEDPAFRGPAVARLSQDARSARFSARYRFYAFVRPLIPVAVRQRLWRVLTADAEPRWYVDDDFDGLLSRALTAHGEGLRLIHPWPDRKDYGLVLTHDVETAEGVRNIEKVAQIEEDLGFRSSWNIVPYGYHVDPGLMRDLRTRSFEIGIHGYNHDGRLYASESIFRDRAGKINEAIKRHGAVGFRSPMVHRQLEWLQMLDIDYDLSCFDTDPYQSMPGGVGSVWPFIAGKFVELQYTLPQDHTLFVALGRRDCGVWREKLEFIRRRHGMALMLTHPDYLIEPRRLDLYRAFLTEVRDQGCYWHAIPRDVATWWRARDRSRVEPGNAGGWIVHGPAAAAGALASLTVEDGTPTIRRVQH